VALPLGCRVLHRQWTLHEFDNLHQHLLSVKVRPHWVNLSLMSMRASHGHGVTAS
jgi:hypothetical protein